MVGGPSLQQLIQLYRLSRPPSWPLVKRREKVFGLMWVWCAEGSRKGQVVGQKPCCVRTLYPCRPESRLRVQDVLHQLSYPRTTLSLSCSPHTCAPTQGKILHSWTQEEIEAMLPTDPEISSLRCDGMDGEAKVKSLLLLIFFCLGKLRIWLCFLGRKKNQISTVEVEK